MLKEIDQIPKTYRETIQGIKLQSLHLNITTRLKFYTFSLQDIKLFFYR